MITQKQFTAKVRALYHSQQSMASAKRWKSGKRKGQLRVPAQPINFDEYELRDWLWRKVGLNAVICRYCRTPIDILTLTLDHIVPRSLGGKFTLDNLDPFVCQDCNHRKGDMTQAGFLGLLEWSRANLSGHDFDTLMKRLLAAHHGSLQRFHRPKADGNRPAPPHPPAANQPCLGSSQDDF